jgi:hypothetical protein
VYSVYSSQSYIYNINERYMYSLQYMMGIVYIVVVLYDWNAWLYSYLFHENVRKSIMCDLSNIQNLI